jgi:hypothetical protein
MAQQTGHIGETNKMVEHHIVDTNKMITAVEWLQEKYNQGNEYERHLTESEFEQAKAMEKEQILNACYQFSDYPFTKEDHLEYYNENYNK